MRIPSAAEFAPLSQVTNMLGLPDPTELLPQLENQLEAVPVSTDHLRTVAGELLGAADELVDQSSVIAWTGTAADAFRAKVSAGANALRQAGNTLNEITGTLDVTPKQVKDIIVKVLQALIVAVGLAVAILGLLALLGVGGTIVVAATGAAVPVLGLIAAILTLVGAIYAAYLFVVTVFPAVSEAIAAIINAILDKLCPREHPTQA